MTKGNLTFTTVDETTISSGEVKRHLMEQLGFPIEADFRRYVGPDRIKSYVRMRVGIDEKYYVKQSNNPGFVEQVLRDNGRGRLINAQAKAVLEQYAYPTNMVEIFRMPDRLEKLAAMGVIGDALEDLVYNSPLAYSATTGQYGIYLRPESIISDMAKDPITNSNGQFKIVKIDGGLDRADIYGDTIRWKIKVIRSNGPVSDMEHKGDLNLLFSTAQR